jgi:hypothetical protein
MSATLEQPADLFAQASRLHAENRLHDAKAVLQRLLDAQPAHAAGLNLLGITHGQQGDLTTGCTLVERAIEVGGDNAIYLRNLCELRRQNDDPYGGVRAGRQAVKIAPSDRIARLNLAMAEHDALELDAAEASTNAVLAAEPANASAHFLRAQLALLRGDLLAGWKDYVWRWRIPGADAPRPAGDVPEWNGVLCVGTLLLLGDQGFGDMIQFARYVPWAQSRCAELVLACPRELKTLFQRAFPGVRVLLDPSRAGDVAAYAHLSSLPGLAGTTLATIPSGTAPYLLADPARMQRWAARLEQLAPRPQRRIGLVWAGRPEHRGDRQRSMKLATFQPLLDLTGITLVSLQKGESVAQIGRCFGPAPLINLGAELEDFDDTAAALTQLDGLVTVDTAVAHLAGALGLPADVLLPMRPDWRWLLNRADTPWYATLRLHRDAGPGMRGATVDAVCQAVRQVLP